MTLTHARCGGVLAPEEHRRWSLGDPDETYRANTPVLLDDLETLHRCDKCGRVGVATKVSRVK
jgi:rRNA maturation protein Nop10